MIDLCIIANFKKNYNILQLEMMEQITNNTELTNLKCLRLSIITVNCCNAILKNLLLLLFVTDFTCNLLKKIQNLHEDGAGNFH